MMATNSLKVSTSKSTQFPDNLLNSILNPSMPNSGNSGNSGASASTSSSSSSSVTVNAQPTVSSPAPTSSVVIPQTQAALNQSNIAALQSEIAVNAVANAIAICNATATCTQLGNAYQQTKAMVNTAVTAASTASAAADAASQAATTAQNLVDQNNLGSDDQANADNAAQAANIAGVMQDQANVAAQATAAASAQCQIIFNLTCVYNGRLPSNFHPIIVPYDDFTNDSCNNGRAFPDSFYVYGNLYVVIPDANDNSYLGCSGSQVITSYSQITNNQLWIPEKIGNRIITLRNYYGGYLSIDNNGIVTCSSRGVCNDANFFDILWSSNLCSSDNPNYVAIRAMNGYYLSVNSGGVTSQLDIYSLNELFKGGLFSPSSSTCAVSS